VEGFTVSGVKILGCNTGWLVKTINKFISLKYLLCLFVIYLTFYIYLITEIFLVLYDK